MAKSKIVKTSKSRKSRKSKPVSGIVTALAILALLLTGGLIITAMQMKTDTEKDYLDLYPTLLSWYVDECPVFADEPYYDEDGKLVVPERKFYHCALVEYGVSKDGDPYAKFNYQKFNPETGEYEGEIETRTMYFQRDGEFEDGQPRYARALGE